jgi:hypothetical protein
MVLDQLFAIQSFGSGVAVQGIVTMCVSAIALATVVKTEFRRAAYFMASLAT